MSKNVKNDRIVNSTTTIKKEVAPFKDKEANVEKMSVAEMIAQTTTEKAVAVEPTISVEKEKEVVEVKPEVPKKKKFNVCAMGAVVVKNESLYRGKGFDFIKKVSGKFYLFDGVNYNGFYKICKSVNDAARRDEKQVVGYISAKAVE